MMRISQAVLCMFAQMWFGRDVYGKLQCYQQNFGCELMLLDGLVLFPKLISVIGAIQCIHPDEGARVIAAMNTMMMIMKIGAAIKRHPSIKTPRKVISGMAFDCLTATKTKINIEGEQMGTE